MTDYVIAIRSYKRSKLFIKRTYRLLSRQNIDLSEKLYIFTANEEETAIYKTALGDRPYKEIVTGVLGGNKIMAFMSDYFPVNSNIFFMDDDILDFYEFDHLPTSKSKLGLKAKTLGRYLEDGFKTLDEEGITAFGFKNMSNALFLKNSPFKELKPAFLLGTAFGMKNSALVKTVVAHGDDTERTANILDKDSGILLYNWAGILTFNELKVTYGRLDGGMQSSNDRGSTPEEKIEKTKAAVDYLYSTSSVKRWFKEPHFSEKYDMWDFKMKSLTVLKRFPILRKRWMEYFGEAEVSYKGELKFAE